MRIFTLCLAIVLIPCLLGTSSADQQEDWADAPARLDLSPPIADPAPMPTPEPAIEVAPDVAPLPPAADQPAPTVHYSAIGAMDSGCGQYQPSCCANVWDGYCGPRRQWNRCRPSCGFSACFPPCSFSLPTLSLPQISLPHISLPHISFASCRSSCCEPACDEVPCCQQRCGHGCMPYLGELRNRCSSFWASCRPEWTRCDCGITEPCGCAISEPCCFRLPSFGWPQIGWGRGSCFDSGCCDVIEGDSYQYDQETIEPVPAEIIPPEPTPASDRAARQPWLGPLSTLFQL